MSYVPKHLALRVIDDARRFSPHLKEYVIEPGCNCVLLGTRHLDDHGNVTYYGSCGSIEQAGQYEALVREGLISDLRSFLPFRNYTDTLPSEPIPDAWDVWLEGCDLAMAVFRPSVPTAIRGGDERGGRPQ